MVVVLMKSSRSSGMASVRGTCGSWMLDAGGDEGNEVKGGGGIEVDGKYV